MSLKIDFKFKISNFKLLRLLSFILLLSLILLIAFAIISRPTIVSPPSVNAFSVGQAPTLSLAASAPVKDILSSAEILDPQGQTVDIPFSVESDPQKPGYVNFNITPASDTPPGTYKVTFKDGQTQIQQDFTWGVLAVNPDQAVYLPGQTANLSLSVLNPSGGMVCDAKINLYVTDPSGKSQELPVTRHPECYIKDFVEKPDYSAEYKTGSDGTYQITLSATTAFGTYTIKDSFRVDSQTPFIVRRTAQTRIYPVKSYPVKIEITARQDFKGPVTEIVPSVFKISQSNLSDLSSSESLLTWNVSLKKGDKKILSYIYQPPVLSPEFYLLGPLKIGDVFSEPRRFQIASDDVSSLRPNSDGTTTNWTSTTCNGTGESAMWGCINDDPDSADDTDYVSGENKIDSSAFFLLSDSPAGFESATSVEIRFRSQENSTANDTITEFYQIFQSNETTAITSESTAAIATASAWFTDYKPVSVTGCNTPSCWDGARVRIRSLWGKVGAADDFSQLRVSAVEVNLTHTPLTINQRAYIFESDDGANVNSNSDMAAANTAITQIVKGQRLTARFQIDNSGASSIARVYQLQYSQDNGSWANVATGSASPNTNTNSDYTSTTISSSDAQGGGNSIAIGTDGFPVISHYDSTPNPDVLVVTKCHNPSCSSSTSNSVSVAATSIGVYSSIAIGTDGFPVISHQNSTSGDLIVSKCNDASCSTSASNSISSGNDQGYDTSIAIGTDGFPVISHIDFTASPDTLIVTKCDNASCSSSTSTPISGPTASITHNTSIAIGTDSFPVVSYRDSAATDLVFIKCGNAACSSGNTTTTLTSANNQGWYSSTAIGTDGLPVISYQDITTTPDSLIITKCGNAACSSGNTTTPITYGSDNIGEDTNIAIGMDGFPVISHQNTTAGDLAVTKCNNLSCSSSTSFTISSGNVQGDYSSIAIGTDGFPVISHRDTTATDLVVTKYEPVTGVNISQGLSGNSGDALTAIAAGSCAVGSSQNGAWYESSPVSTTVTLAADTCTELAFMVDTSEANPGSVYKLRLATADGTSFSNYYQFPTFTMLSPPNNSYRYSKATIPNSGANTYSSSAATTTSGTTGNRISLAVGTDGFPVISHREENADGLKVTKCNNTSCSSSSSIIIPDSGLLTRGQYSSIAIGADGYPVIAHHDSGTGALELIVTKCSNPSCSSYTNSIVIQGTDAIAFESISIAIGTDGFPVIPSYDFTTTDLIVTKCSTASCSSYSNFVITSANSQGQYNNIAIGTDGFPVIAYEDISTTPDSLVVTKCGNAACSSGNTTTTITNGSDDIGAYNGIAIGTDGLPIISTYDASNGGDLLVVKCGNTACSSGNTLTVISDGTDDIGTSSSIAIGTDGLPVISSQNVTDTDLEITKCSNSSCTSASSSPVVSANNQGLTSTSIAIGANGLPVIAHRDATPTPDTLVITIETTLPTIATGYFGNGLRSDRQLKYHQSTSDTWPQFAAASPLLEDGLDYWFDNLDYSNTASDDSSRSNVTSASGESPMFLYINKTGTNSPVPLAVWKGQSTVAASTNSFTLQIFRFGSTNAWETVDTDTTCAANTDCVLNGSPTGTVSEYYFARPEYDSYKRYKNTNSKYFTYWRVYQAAGSQTLKTNYFNAHHRTVNFQGINMTGVNID